MRWNYAVLSCTVVGLGMLLGPVVRGNAQQAVPSKHGQTRVYIPDPLFKINVDEQYGVTTVGSTTIRVDHSDAGTFCNKVRSVGIRLAPLKGNWTEEFYQEYRPGGNDAGLCSFNANDVSATIAFPPISNPAVKAKARPELEFEGFCRTKERAESGWKGMVPYHLAVITLDYGDGAVADAVVNRQPTRVEVTCAPHPCPPISLLQYGNRNYTALPVAPLNGSYSVRLFSGGRQPVYATTGYQLPGLTLDSTGMLTGKPAKEGTYNLDLNVSDACPFRNTTQLGTAKLTVKDMTPPKLLAVTVAPDSLPSSGGNVTLTVAASDNRAVSSVTMLYVQPDGRQSGLRLELAFGSPNDGRWQAKWQIPVNVDATPKLYSVKVTIADSDTNVVAGPTRNIKVAGKAAGPAMPGALPGQTIPRRPPPK